MNNRTSIPGPNITAREGGSYRDNNSLVIGSREYNKIRYPHKDKTNGNIPSWGKKGLQIKLN